MSFLAHKVGGNVVLFTTLDCFSGYFYKLMMFDMSLVFTWKYDLYLGL